MKSFDFLKPLLITVIADTTATVQPLADNIPTDIHIVLKDIGYILSIIYAIVKLYKETPHYKKRQSKKQD